MPGDMEESIRLVVRRNTERRFFIKINSKNMIRLLYAEKKKMCKTKIGCWKINSCINGKQHRNRILKG